MLEVIALVVAAGANALLGLFVFLKNTRSATNRFFALMTSAFVVWSVVNYFSLHPFGLSQLVWVRLVLFFASWLCLAVYLTFKVLPNHDIDFETPSVWLAAVATGVIAPLTLTNWVFTRLSFDAGRAQPVPGPLIPLFALLVVGLLGGGVFNVIRKFRRARGIEREQFRFVLLGIAGSFGLIVLTNFVFVVALNTTALVPFGASFTLVFTGALAYAIIRHRLLDIRAVVARSVAYVLLLASLAGIYAGLIFGITALAAPEGRIPLNLRLLYIALAVGLAFSFQPLRRFFEKLTDRIFFRDSYETQEVLGDLSKILAQELLLARMLDRSLNKLCQSLRVRTGQFIVLEEGQLYKVAHFGPLPERLIVVPELKRLDQTMLVADELPPGTRKQVLDRHGIRVSLILRTSDEFVGFLLLGDKLSGDIFSSQDLEMLEILSSELAVAISNAKAYEEISRFNVTLREKIAAATAELRTANTHLKELDKAKDEFISMASHQLRTPLTTIKGYISMLMEGDAGRLTDEQREFLQYAFSGSDRMVSLISDLLNVSRMSAGRFVIDKTPTDLAKMTAEEVQQLKSHAEAKQLKLIYQPPAQPLPKLNIDEGKTRQVVMNFIDNSIYYTQKGSVTVKLEAVGGAARLTVTDTGIGVPPEARAKLFSKFYRAGNAQKVRPDGTGLGLYLAKRVIADQGGRILFKSTEGVGSTFGFELPLRETASVSRTSPLPQPSAAAPAIVKVKAVAK